MLHVHVRVNGVEYERMVEPRLLLSDFLRDSLGLTGTHVGCEHGICGACTVMLPESLLKGMKFSSFGESFNSRHLRPICLNSEDETRADGLPVQHHSTGAADTVLATHVSTRKA